MDVWISGFMEHSAWRKEQSGKSSMLSALSIQSVI